MQFACQTFALFEDGFLARLFIKAEVVQCNGQLVASSVRGPVQTCWLEDSYHMVTIDRERRKVAARTVEFIEQTLAAQGRHATAPVAA